MNTLKWIARCALGLGVGTLVFSCANTTGQTGSETNWYSKCTRTADCSSGLECLCGVCTKRCTSTTTCKAQQPSACLPPGDPVRAALCASFAPVPTGLCAAICPPMSEDCGFNGYHPGPDAGSHPDAASGGTGGTGGASVNDASLDSAIDGASSGGSEAGSVATGGSGGTGGSTGTGGTGGVTVDPELGCGSLDGGAVPVTGQVAISTNPEDPGVDYYAALGTGSTVVGPGGNIVDLTFGTDGNAWFVVSGTLTPLGAPNPLNDVSCASNFVGRLTSAGSVTKFFLPRRNGKTLSPESVVAGFDGNLWITADSEVLRMTPLGEITEYAPQLAGAPFHIIRGTDGNLWFTELNSEKIGRIDSSGTVTEFFAGGAVDFANSTELREPLVMHRAIAVGPDGDPRFSLYIANGIWTTGVGKLLDDGGLSDPVGPAQNATWNLITLAVDAQDSTWFADWSQPVIVRLNAAGKLDQFIAGCLKDGAPFPYAEPTSVVAPNPAGGIWFTRPFELDRMDASGTNTCFPIHGPVGTLYNSNTKPRIVAGAHGDLWFSDTAGTAADLHVRHTLTIGHLTP